MKNEKNINSPSTVEITNSSIDQPKLPEFDKKVQIIKKTEKNTNYDYLFKIALIGDSGIGKSSILIRFTDNDFREDTSSTIGVDFKIVSVALSENIKAKMQIWDTCGSERFKSLTSSFIKSCPTFLLIFDITKQKSFISLENWINLINESTSPKLLCLIGNKSDLEQHRQVKKEDALLFAEKHNLKYIETSAKTSENIEDIFIHVAMTLYEEVCKNKNELGKNDKFEIGGFKNLQNLNKEQNNINNKSEENLRGKCCLK